MNTNKKYSKIQITEAMRHWKKVLEEDYNMSEQEIQEGLFKNLGSKVVNVGKSLVKGIRAAKGFFSDVGENFHDAFLTNNGINQLLKSWKEAKEAHATKDNTLICCQINNKKYPIIGISVTKKFVKGRLLVLQIDENKEGNLDDTGNIAKLIQTLKDEYNLKPNNMSNDFEGITCSSNNKAGESETSEMNFADVACEDGKKIKIADNNKFLNAKFLKHEGKNYIGFVFQKSKSQEKADQKNKEDDLG